MNMFIYDDILIVVDYVI